MFVILYIFISYYLLHALTVNLVYICCERALIDCPIIVNTMLTYIYNEYTYNEVLRFPFVYLYIRIAYVLM